MGIRTVFVGIFLFLASLVFALPALAQVTRGPYLQMGTQTSVVIKWRTSSNSSSKVEIGTVYGSYTTSFTNASSVQEHTIQVTGLTADKKYFYRIGTTSSMQPSDPDQFFTTLPLSNTTRKLRFAAFGDCGRNVDFFQSLTLSEYRAYLSDQGVDACDAWLLLGDNAYENGTDAEYTSGFFGAYGSSILKNHKLYPVPGNHDYANRADRQADHLVPYYNVFNLPTNAEIGGVASGTEAYYSYDVGNVHFLALDAYGEEGGGTRLYDTSGAQVTWVKNDLAANNKKWTIAYWHHPPYTKGNHDSDTEDELIDIRENFIRILERNGVDLIVCGHSHDYERSYLLNGYYKTAGAGTALKESDFNAATHTSSQSSGKYDNSASSCPYTYASGKSRHGTVYVVAGSSGAIGSVKSGYPHNALPFSQNSGGMFYFEVDNNRLDAKFIRIDGQIADKFTIMKDVNKSTDLETTIGSPVTLTASWPGNYHWNNSSTSKSITVTPSTPGTVQYAVDDVVNCISDEFTVTAASALPVSLLNYDVKLNEEEVLIHWATVFETNNKYFVVERSGNGRDFTVIGKVDGHSASVTEKNYAFIDAHPVTGLNYYRLSQTDTDGKTQVIGIKTITYNGGKKFSVKTLSSGSQKLTLQITSPVSGICRVHIFTLTGSELSNELVSISPGYTKKEIPLVPGAYVWRVENDNGEIVTKKAIVR